MREAERGEVEGGARNEATAHDLGGLDRVVFECLARMEESGLEAIEELARRWPEHSDALRRRMRLLVGTGLLDEPGDTLPERLGEYRILGTLGGGGMGTVHLARQETLGREVALKVLRGDLLFFPDARRRFRREAEVLSRLEHPGIVPVHAFGEERGVPYLVMPCVRGATLAELVEALRERGPAGLTGRDLHDALVRVVRSRGHDQSMESGGKQPDGLFAGTWVEACVGIVEQVAHALDHAHRQGVLHRDVKPSNVLLTLEGRAQLLDFGLARSEQTSEITATGTPVGSLPYMAPEQLEGQLAGQPAGSTLDRRADVYGLGLVLYELLTLEPAFRGNRELDLRRAILDGVALSVRRANPALPADLESICQKATDRDPERRYATAAELALDLRNLLEHRPVSARPAGIALRARRWARRNPTASVAAALTASIAVVGPLVFGLQQRTAAREQGRLNLELERQRDRAREQGLRAEANLAKALEAVDSMLTKVGDERLKDVPRAATVRRELLESALAFYQDLADEHPDDPALIAELLRAELRCAGVQRLIGRSAESEASYRRAWDSLSAGRGAIDPAERTELMVRAAAGLASLQLERGGAAEAEATARSGLERLADRAFLGSEARSSLRSTLARAMHAQGQSDAALEELRGICAELEALLEGPQGNDGVREQLERALTTLAGELMTAGRDEEALPVLEREQVLLEDLVARYPDDVSLRSHLGRAHANLVRAGRSRGPDWQQQHAEAALDLLGGLASEQPDVVNVRFDLIVALNSLASLRRDRGEDAAPLSERARTALEELVRDEPANTKYRSTLATMYLNAAALALDAGRGEEGLQWLDRCQSELERCLAIEPERPDLVEIALVVRTNRAHTLLSLDRLGEVLDELENLPDWPQWRPYMSGASACCRVLTRLGRAPEIEPEEARELEARAIDLALALLEDGLDRGFSDLLDLRTRDFWEPLRGIPDFEALVDRLARAQGE